MAVVSTTSGRPRATAQITWLFRYNDIQTVSPSYDMLRNEAAVIPSMNDEPAAHHAIGSIVPPATALGIAPSQVNSTSGLPSRSRSPRTRPFILELDEGRLDEIEVAIPDLGRGDSPVTVEELFGFYWPASSHDVWRATICQRSRLTHTSVTSIEPLRSWPATVARCM